MRRIHLYNNYLRRKIVGVDWRSQALRSVAFSTRLVGSAPHTKVFSANKYFYLVKPLVDERTPHMPVLSGAAYKHLLGTFYGPTILKCRYLGKSYRVRYKESIVFLRFNRAHRTTLLTRGITIAPYLRKWFRLRLRFALHPTQLLVKTLSCVRARNLFTRRGLWLRRSLFYKKRGKVSAYR